MLALYKIVRTFCAPPLPQDIKKLFPLLTTAKDRHLEVLQTMASLYNHHRDSQYLTDNRKKQLKAELQKYKGGRGRKQKIASIAWVIIKLDLARQCKEMLHEFAQSVGNDQWYVNFDEAVKAMEAFTWVEDDFIRNELYDKIERNVQLTIWQVNISYYCRISEALVKAKRLDSSLWDKLQYHILNNLSMEYSIKLILDTFHNFALAQKGSAQFYYALQQTIYKGHLFEKSFFLQGLVQHSYSSQLVSTLFRTFGLCSRSQGMVIDPDFSAYMLKILNHPRFVLEELGHIVGILEHLDPFMFGKEIDGEVRDRLLRQVKSIQGYINLPEVVQFYERTQYMGIEVPKQIVEDISAQCLKSIMYGPRRLDAALQVYSYLQRHGLTGNELFVPLVEQWLQKEARYFSKDELKALIGTMAQFNKKVQCRNTDILIVNPPQGAARNLLI